MVIDADLVNCIVFGTCMGHTSAHEYEQLHQHSSLLN